MSKIKMFWEGVKVAYKSYAEWATDNTQRTMAIFIFAGVVAALAWLFQFKILAVVSIVAALPGGWAFINNKLQGK